MSLVYDFISGIDCGYWLLRDLRARLLKNSCAPIGFAHRLGVKLPEVSFNHPVWIQAASVGEIMAAKQFITDFQANFKDKQILITTLTPEALEFAKREFKGNVYVAYFPFDFSFYVDEFLRKLKPSMLIIIDNWFSFNLFHKLKKQPIPFFVICGYFASRWFSQAQVLGCWIKPLLKAVTRFFVHTPEDGLKLTQLGVGENKISLSGNIKFDIHPTQLPQPSHRAALRMQKNEKLFLAASTHYGEERIIAEVYKKLFQEYPELKLLIAPRYPKMAEGMEKVMHNLGLEAHPVSRISESNCEVLNKKFKVFILDTIGDLILYYPLADMVFVGGSLIKGYGGHNLIEPAAFAKPILFGPHMDNFKKIAESFLLNNAALEVKGADSLLAQLKILLADPQAGQRIGKQAADLVAQNKGATAFILNEISRIIR